MKHPKCNKCHTSMISLYHRRDSERKNDGYICPFCNGYSIFAGPNVDGPIPKNIGPVFIGLNKVRKTREG